MARQDLSQMATAKMKGLKRPKPDTNQPKADVLGAARRKVAEEKAPPSKKAYIKQERAAIASGENYLRGASVFKEVKKVSDDRVAARDRVPPTPPT